MDFDFADILMDVVSRNASDLHITAGAPPSIRVRGRLVGLDGYPVLSTTDTREIVYSILTNDQRQKLESLGVLAGGVAHDFNNLLTGILGNASMVLDTGAPAAEDRPCLEAIVKTAERAAALTRQLLAYAGKGRSATTSVNLS